MKARVMIFGYVFLLGYSLLHSMEIAPLLSKKTPREELENYFNKTLPNLKLSEIGESYCALQAKCRGKLVCYMSSELLMLHHIALWLPQEIQSKVLHNVRQVMFEDDEEAMEKFYNKEPILEAFQLYAAIQKTIGYNKPIAPLYKISRQNREDILDKLKPWYSAYAQQITSYVDPVMSIKEQQALYGLDEEVQQYFQGKDVRVLSESEIKRHKKALLWLFACPFMSCIISPLLSSVLCCVGGVGLACSPAALGTVLGASPVIGCAISSAGGYIELSVQCDSSKKITL